MDSSQITVTVSGMQFSTTSLYGWMRQPTKCLCSCVSTLKSPLFVFIGQRVLNTLIVVDRYLRLMGDGFQTRQPRLESFYPPFVAGTDHIKV